MLGPNTTSPISTLNQAATWPLRSGSGNGDLTAFPGGGLQHLAGPMLRTVVLFHTEKTPASLALDPPTLDPHSGANHKQPFPLPVIFPINWRRRAISNSHKMLGIITLWDVRAREVCFIFTTSFHIGGDEALERGVTVPLPSYAADSRAETPDPTQCSLSASCSCL